MDTINSNDQNFYGRVKNGPVFYGGVSAFGTLSPFQRVIKHNSPWTIYGQHFYSHVKKGWLNDKMESAIAERFN